MARAHVAGTSSVALVVMLAGCVSWQPAVGGPRAVLDTERPEVIRITSDQGTLMVIEDPLVQDDWIVGTFEACRVESGGRPTCGEARGPVVQLGSVRSLEVQRQDRTKTVVAIAVAATAASIVYALIWAAQACADGAEFFC